MDRTTIEHDGMTAIHSGLSLVDRTSVVSDGMDNSASRIARPKANRDKVTIVRLGNDSSSQQTISVEGKME